ncbi:DNA-binding response regulator [Rhodoferax lacus]|uniref:DNA-binding response regulator n=1 Tax=Rhodoferax lacus TaxID=2184758 RepID=A0A3E1RBR1_9BURK|nr:response regulator [Rhodoferax lacus]RFO96100.1 DNA-binding response regulator [Rhodoferax lacus]
MSTAAAEQPTVHLVDDEATVRAALEFLLASHGLAVCSYGGGRALLERLDAGPPLVGCILLDVRMEPLSGLQVHDELVARGVHTPVIFLTGHGDIRMAVAALKKGAFDFVEKPFGDAALVERVRDALALDAEQQQRLRDGDSRGVRLAALTPREQDVMQRVAAGKLNKVIADEMNVSMRTVEVYRARVYAKLGVRSSAELATLLARM